MAPKHCRYHRPTLLSEEAADLSSNPIRKEPQQTGEFTPVLQAHPSMRKCYLLCAIPEILERESPQSNCPSAEIGEVGSLWMLHTGKPGMWPGSPIEAERRIIL
jgi:hypothetical protein